MLLWGEIMLVNSKQLLIGAKDNKYAIPQFNINNLEWAKYILEAALQLKAPVILGVSEGAVKYMGGYKTVYNIVTGLIDDLKITIPVVLHLDHGRSFESCKEAIDQGFTSVMIDASSYDLETNVSITKEVVDYAILKNVSVEAELGEINQVDINFKAQPSYVKVEDASFFVKETKIDSLAPALGSVHGLYKGIPKLNFKLMSELSDKINMPLVLHGGTGIPSNMITKAIANGITKININTDLQVAWTNEIRKYLDKNKDVYDPRKIIGAGEMAIKNKVEMFVFLLGSNNRY